MIKGKVQGVFYRVSAKEAADNLDITGTVKNTREGNVEITAVGSNENIDKLINWCHRGPSRAKVDDVEVRDLPIQQFNSFDIIE
jgi:acylphosphatase